MAILRITYAEDIGGKRLFRPGEHLPIGAAQAVSAGAAPTFTGSGRLILEPDAPCRVAIGTAPDATSASALTLKAGETREIAATTGAKVAVFAALPEIPGSTEFGRKLLAAASGQIPFPVVASPSTDPNTLDDYREGTWQPGLTAATAPTGVTYAERTGRYIKIGRMLFLEGRVTLSSKGTGGSGVAIISGLPFGPVGISFTTQFRHGGATLPAGTLLSALVQTSGLVLQAVNNGGSNDVSYATLTDNFDAIFSASFITAS